MADRNAREDVDDECDNTEDRRKGHQYVHRLAEVHTESRDVRCVAENTKIEKEDGQLGRPDGEFVQYLCPPEPLLKLAMQSAKSGEGWYHESSRQLFISKGRHDSTIASSSRFVCVREDFSDQIDRGHTQASDGALQNREQLRRRVSEKNSKPIAHQDSPWQLR